LVDAVPLGDAFEMGLYSLLDEQQAATASEEPPHHDSDLPQRAQGEARGDDLGDADQVVAGASTRSPDQVRSLLSNYRSARERGRLDAAVDDPEPPAGDHVPAPGGFDPLGGRSFAGEEGHTDEPGRR
jgi:hypothetical protein